MSFDRARIFFASVRLTTLAAKLWPGSMGSEIQASSAPAKEFLFRERRDNFRSTLSRPRSRRPRDRACPNRLMKDSYGPSAA